MSPKTENPDPFRPLQKEALIDKPAAQLFDLFTRMSDWWPHDSHSMGREASGGIQFPAAAGLEITESVKNGPVHIWGEVERYEPPALLVFSWHPGRPKDEATEVEIRFISEGPELTRVQLVHRGWQRLAGEPVNWRAEYDKAWDFILNECFASCARRI